MKGFVFKNKKILSVVLAALSILFLVLMIINLTSVERDAYQMLYDNSSVLYDTYREYADSFEGYGYSSKAEEFNSEANDNRIMMTKYENKLFILNMQVAVYAVFMVGSLVGIIIVLKTKKEAFINNQAVNQNFAGGGDL